MRKHSDPPSIDVLLKASRWDARLAEARARREAVLAARAASAVPLPDPAPPVAPPPEPVLQAPLLPDPPLPEMEVFLRRNPAPQPRPGRRALALAIGAGAVIGVLAGGVTAWALGDRAGAYTPARPDRQQTALRQYIQFDAEIPQMSGTLEKHLLMGLPKGRERQEESDFHHE